MVSRRKATRKVHKAEKQLEKARNDLEPEEDPFDEDLDAILEELIDHVRNVKEELKPKDQKNLDRF